MEWTQRVFGETSLPPHIWLGVSVENQDYVWRIEQLQQAPAKVRFLSVEPLLGPVNLTDYLKGIHWVIVGGESGRNARPCHGRWIQEIVDQCRGYDTQCFVKQLGARPVLPALAQGCICNATNGLPIIRHPKGGDPEEWPTSLRVREFPTPPL